MTTILKPRALGVFLSVLLCSCATTPKPSAIIPEAALPGEVNMNKEAGRGGHLFVMVRLESGEELPFGVDTGSPLTAIDRSLEARLGKRYGELTFLTSGETQRSGIYTAPKLYLGITPLVMRWTNVVSYDFRQFSSDEGHPILGILGMDILRHYCLQLDFEAGKVRFLDPNHLNAAELGKAFPLLFSSEEQSSRQLVRPFIYHRSLAGGEKTRLLIDTGRLIDSVMEPRLLQRQVRQQGGDVPAGESALLPKCVWEGETYTNLAVGAWPARTQSPNLIGLRFLARHLVTLNFPGRTMYLKRTRAGPLTN